MILFIAPNPKSTNKHEGFLQRISAIDKLFIEEEKIYYEDLSGDAEVTNALLRARTIYVHSIYEAARVIDLYEIYGYKIITDLHGVVVEELALAGEDSMTTSFAAIEAKVFQYSTKFVVVTKAMADYFEKKYSYQNNEYEWITLPIFNSFSGGQCHKKNAKPLHIIYAGGAQPWQNVNLMLEATRKLGDKYKFTYLTHDTQMFQGIKDLATVKSVDHNEISEYYQKSHFGLMLRDNSVINRVACPTKLIEYLENDIIPIIKDPNIGDFIELGYQYVTIEQITSKDFSDKEMIGMIRNNRKVLRKLLSLTNKSKVELRDAVLQDKSRLINIDTILRSATEGLLKINKLELDKAVTTEKLSAEVNLLHAIKSELKAKSTELDDIKKSKSFKMGNFISMPYRMIKLVIKRVFK